MIYRDRSRPALRRWFFGLLVAASAYSVAASAPSGKAGQQGAAIDAASDLTSVLHAAGPHPSLGDNASTFDRFVGSWDVDYAFHAPDGTISRRTGEVHFGWVLDGRAIQDVWITHADKGDRELGTTIRFFDAKAATWRVVWIYLPRGIVAAFSGGAEGDRIVLRGSGEDGSLVRWSFNDIEPNSFVWRGERSYDGGKSWRLTGEYRMRRKAR